MEKTGDVQKLNQPRPKVPWWKRTYLVNREFQNRYARTAVLIGIFNSILSIGLLLWAFWAFNIWQGQRLPVPVRVIILFVFLLNWMGIYIAGVLSTQKISGPLFNLLRQFQRITKGDFQARAKFRENDEIHYVARGFNEMAVHLESTQKKTIELLKALEDHVANGDQRSSFALISELQHLHEAPPSPPPSASSGAVNQSE